jgi:hypothetical protein
MVMRVKFRGGLDVFQTIEQGFRLAATGSSRTRA